VTSQTHYRPDSQPSLARTRHAPIDRRRQYRRRARISDVLVTLLWASGAASVALFLSVGGVAQFTSLAEWSTSIGIITGLIGTDFILVMLVLAARIPLIDRAIGHDRAMATHRRLGKPVLYLLLAHAVFLVIGYGLSSGINPIVEIFDMFAIPDLPLAYLGLGLLVVVVITSLVAVRRRYSYEVWYVIHLLSYAAVLVAIPHELSAGGVLSDGTLQRAYWISLYVLAFGAIIVFRFLEPLVSSIRHDLRVDSVETIAPGVVSIHLRGRNVSALGSAGGQFFIWRFWTARTWWHSHPISLSATPTATTARITVRDLGSGTSRISQLPRGTTVSLQGPYGLFTDAARTAPKLAIVTAGIGITPVRALLEQSRLAPGEATILLRAANEGETYLWDEIAELAAAKGATLYTMVGHRSRVAPEWMTDADAGRGVTLQSIFPDLANSDLYICGPTSWLELVEADAHAAGIPKHQLHTERFDW
jgi:predicted ferric reductase